MKMRNFKDERFKGWCSRTIALKFESLDEKNRSVECIMTTEDPAIVFDWWNWKYIREIILMKGTEFESEVPFINSHKRDDIENLLGTTKEMRVEGDSLIGRNYFSSTAEKAWTLTKEGHLKNYSVGYQTFEENSIELKPNQEVEIDGRKFVNNYTDGLDMVIRKRVVIKENSSVILGADKRAKARAEGISAEDEDLQDELEKMFAKFEKDFEQKLDIKINSIKSQGGPTMADKVEKTQEQIKLELMNDIDDSAENLGEAGKTTAAEYRKKIRAMETLTEDDSKRLTKEFYKAATDLLMKNGGASNKPVTFLGLNENEIKNFSPAKAAQQILMGKRSGFEFELSKELEGKTGISIGDKSILLPPDIQNSGLRDMLNISKRAHTVAVAAEGGNLVTNEFYGNLLKEVIRNQTVLGQVGATIITGLRGTFQLPKITTGLTIYSAAENTTVATSYIVTGLDEVSPKRLSGNTEYGRQLFFQTDESLAGFDQILMRDLYQAMNVKVDYEGINGTGLSNRPTGILNQSGIAAPSLSSVTHKRMVNFKRKVAKLNGLKDAMKFLSSVDAEALLETTELTPGAPSGKMIYANGRVINYPHLSSNQVPDAVEIFGNWPEFYILNWGVEEMVVADQPQHKLNMVEISIHRLVNFFLRSAESFAIADDMPVISWNDLDA